MALVLRNLIKLNKRLVFCQMIPRQTLTSTTEGENEKETKKEEAPKIPDNVIVEKKEAVTLIGLNRPEKRNCVDSLTANQLEAGKKYKFY